jgi:hypothetical protein
MLGGVSAISNGVAIDHAAIIYALCEPGRFKAHIVGWLFHYLGKTTRLLISR